MPRATTEKTRRSSRTAPAAVAEEKPTRGRKAAPAAEEPAPSRSRRSKAAPAVEEAPTRRRRGSAAADQAEAAPTTRRARASRAVKEESAAPTRSRRSSAAKEEPAAEEKTSRRRSVAVEGKKTKAAEAVSDAFNPYANLDDKLDEIEKSIGVSESTLDPTEVRLSTGSLMQDLVLGGGITAGWYTNFGQEQCCKTTDAVQILISALNSNVPILGYYDYEGCLTYDAQIHVNGKQQHLGDLFVGLELKPYMAFDLSKFDIKVKSPCGYQQVVAASYKGSKPITRVKLVDDKELEGYKHPVLVCTTDGCLQWKYLEELNVGDQVVTES